MDAAVALDHAGGPRYAETLGPARPYAKTVFLAPPWPEIYASDAERKHGFAEAKAEYDRLAEAFGQLGHDTLAVPKAPVGDRVACVLTELGMV